MRSRQKSEALFSLSKKSKDFFDRLKSAGQRPTLFLYGGAGRADGRGLSVMFKNHLRIVYNLFISIH